MSSSMPLWRAEAASGPPACPTDCSKNIRTLERASAWSRDIIRIHRGMKRSIRRTPTIINIGFDIDFGEGNRRMPLGALIKPHTTQEGRRLTFAGPPLDQPRLPATGLVSRDLRHLPKPRSAPRALVTFITYYFLQGVFRRLFVRPKGQSERRSPAINKCRCVALLAAGKQQPVIRSGCR